MNHPRFKPSATKLQTLTNFHYRYTPSCHIHGDKTPRPHKRTRNQRRPPIPFINHLKNCQNPDEFLSLFYNFHDLGYKHDYPSYASLTYKLARAGKFEDIDVLLEFLQTLDIRCGEAMFIGLIRHYGKAGLVHKALAIFNEMGRSLNCVRTVQSFNTILNVLVDRGQSFDAIKLFENGRGMGFRLNSVSYNIMIKMWLEKGEWDKARKVFDEMLDKEIEPTAVTYNSQIGYLCKRGEIDEAKRFFEDMMRKGKQGNAVTYALLMEGLCSLGKLKEAKKLMFDMEYHGCKVELVNYGVLMTGLVNRNLIDEAKALLVEMRKKMRIKPDVVMYNILINCLCKQGDVSKGYKMLVDMQVEGCEPNAATYRMVVDGFCGVGDFDGALRVLSAMLHGNHFPRIETFRCVVLGLVRSGRIDDAGFVLEEMKNRNKTMWLGLELWEMLIGECCFVEDASVCFDRALC